MGLILQSQRRLSEFSTFGIGGPIDFFVEVTDLSQMREAVLLAKQKNIPFWILGKGSNCLFSDTGFRGLAILNKIDFCEWKSDSVTAGAGYSFALLGVQSARKGFSGLEFASGIPATVGGAVFMNAGANGQETLQNIQNVTYLHADGHLKIFSKEQISFSYRTSLFQTLSGAIIDATFSLTSSLDARKRQLEIVDYRLKTQPYKDKSAGCIFRNPSPTTPAGAIIDRCGLKGFSIGGAKVSEMHANFIVNTGSATAADVLALIRAVQKKVFEQTGIHLEPEVRTL